MKNKLYQFAHDDKNTNVKREVVKGLAETNKEKLSLTSKWPCAINYISFFTITEEIIQSTGSGQSQKTYKLHFMGT